MTSSASNGPQVNWGKPLALAVVLTVLGGSAYWLEYSHRPKKEKQEEQEKKLVSISDQSVASIRIVYGDEPVTLRCLDLESKGCKSGDNSKWELTEPRKLRADDTSVNSLVSSISNLNPADTIDLSDEKPEKQAALLKEYGLDPATRANPKSKRIEVALAGGGSWAIYLGERRLGGDDLYALTAASGKVNETKVQVVPAYFLASFKDGLGHWRDKKLMSVQPTQVKSFTLQGTEGKVTATRKAAGGIAEWVLAPGLPGDPENIDGLLSSLAYLTAKEFAADSKDDAKGRELLKGAKKILTFTIETEGGAAASTDKAKTGKGDEKSGGGTVTLTLFEKMPGNRVLATVSNADPVYEVEPGVRNRLGKKANELRLSKLVTTMEHIGTKKLEFESPDYAGKPLVLTQADSKWYTDPGHQEVDREKVQAFLDRISGNRIKEFLDASKAPAGEKQGLRVTMTSEEGGNAKSRQLIFWKSGDKLYARDPQAPRKDVFVVDTAIRDTLPWTRERFDLPAKGGTAAASSSTSPATNPAASSTPAPAKAH